MSDALLLGVDVGSTRLKAVLVDEAGAVVALAAVTTPFAVTTRGVEMSVEDLAAALGAAVAALPGEARRAVAAIGVAGLAESGAPLAAGLPCAPVIAWHDGRGEEVAVRLADRLGDALALRIGGRPRSVSSVAKLGWLLANGAGPVDRWLGVPELCLWLLTGAQATDFSLAARTGAYDLGSGEWIPEVFEVAGLPPGVFLDPSAAGTPMGCVGATAAARFGVPAGIPVTLAGHDHLGAAESLGGLDAAFNSVGTAECVLAFVPALPDMGRALEHRLAVTRRPSGDGFAVLAGAARAGLVLSELAARLGRTHVELDALGLDTGSGRIWHAELGALAERTVEAATRLAALVGRAPRVVAFGGGSGSAPWLAAKARLLAPTPLWRAVVGEATARGAALAAGVAVGWWPTPAAGPHAPLEPVGVLARRPP